VQELELNQFLEENKWVSAAEIINPGADAGSQKIQLDVSPAGHDLIREQGLQSFEQQIQSGLSMLGIAAENWQIRPYSNENRGRLACDPEHNFPAILSRIDDYPRHRILLDISPELGWFEGHFPGNPVLAGVVQLHWAVGVSLALFRFSEVPVEIKRLKFKNIVIPPRVLELTLELCNEQEVQFEFTSMGQVHSLGRLIFVADVP
jgi:3-hydroxymyristoyl/3-hydroxydecanoyl-(acyl carrier protein) dehydratase